MASTVHWRELLAHPRDSDHIAQVYLDEDFLTEAAGHFICSGLQNGEGVLVAAGSARRQAFHDYAALHAVDLKSAERCGQLQYLDAASLLSSFMTGGVPDRARFLKIVGGIVHALQARFPRIRAYGEMVDLLWRREQPGCAARVEEFWNVLRDRQPFALLCGYCVDCLDPLVYGGPLQRICRAHTHLVANQDDENFRHAVIEAAQQVLGPSLANLTQALAANNPAATRMPSGQAMLFYLSENMPHAADRVFSLARAGCPAPAPGR